MVSTRGPKYKFVEGERVLCYEPDPTKTKVLYDSKVLGVVETRDKRGKKIIQYKIHFQGWNSSWDRRVNEDYVLKDTDENRQLQKDLAQKAQLQLAAYLYRRERKKRSRKESGTEVSPKIRNRGSSEDGSSCGTVERNENEYLMRDDCDTESYSSSIDSVYDEDRVFLQVGEKIKQYLDFDYEMVVKNKRVHNLPAKTPIVTILESFVKQTAVRILFSPPQNENPRRRTSVLRPEKREKDVEKQINSISLLKEVADGLRIYFDFTVKEYLLYSEEGEQATSILSEESLKNFTYVPSNHMCLEFMHLKSISPDTPAVSEHANSTDINPNNILDLCSSQEDNSRRRLRSHRTEENEVMFDFGFPSCRQDNCISSIASTSSGSSTPHTNIAANGSNFVKIIPPLNVGVPTKVREAIQDVLSWQMLPSDAQPEPSMIYGASHLARLVVKLPDFLNATTMSDERMKILLKHLDSFIAYLESHKELFGEHNYKDSPPKSPSPPPAEPVKVENEE